MTLSSSCSITLSFSMACKAFFKVKGARVIAGKTTRRIHNQFFKAQLSIILSRVVVAFLTDAQILAYSYSPLSLVGLQERADLSFRADGETEGKGKTFLC